MVGIVDITSDKFSRLITLSDGRVVHFGTAFSTSDGLDAVTNDHKIDINAVIESKGSLTQASSFMFESSSGTDFTISEGENDSLIITRADGTVAIIDSGKMDWYDRMTTTTLSDTTVIDRTIDIDAIFAHPGANGAVSNAYVFIVGDSTGGDFTVTRGSTNDFLITRDNGEVITMRDPYAVSTSADRMDTSGGLTDARDYNIDVAGLSANPGDSSF